MTALVTGACGFVGANVVRRLAADSEVLAIDIAAPDPQVAKHWAGAPHSIEFVNADITDPGWGGALPTGVVDLAVHAAAVTPVTPEEERHRANEVVRVNVAGVAAFYEWAAGARPARVVHVSSGGVYGTGPAGAEALSEDMPLNPETMYGITKAAGERIAARMAGIHELSLTIVRLTHTFGPLERPTSARTAMSPLHAWCTAAVRGQQIGTTAPERLRDYAYVDDVAEAIVRLAARRTAQGSAYNISSGRPISERETLDLVSSVIPVERSDALSATEAVSSARPPLDVRRLAADADFICTPDLRAAIANYIHWLRAEPDG